MLFRSDRVGIIDQGALIAEGTRRELVDMIGENAHVRVGATGDLATLADRCRRLDGVSEASITPEGMDLSVSDSARALVPVVEAAESLDVSITAIEVSEPDLETVFLHLTGKALRD